jgi:hypothetical protein
MGIRAIDSAFNLSELATSMSALSDGAPAWKYSPGKRAVLFSSYGAYGSSTFAASAALGRTKDPGGMRDRPRSREMNVGVHIGTSSHTAGHWC